MQKPVAQCCSPSATRRLGARAGADATLYTQAGPEIGVAATKTFTAQCVAMVLFALHLAAVRGTVDTKRRSRGRPCDA